MRSKERSECLRRARVERGLYQCALCPTGKLTRAKDVQVDHTQPIVPLTGWVSFDSFIVGLWCAVEDLQVLCTEHHREKTEAERQVRKQLKPKKEKKKKCTE